MGAKMVSYWLATILLAVASAVWALILVGAWASSLEHPGCFERLVISRRFADPIMRRLVREVGTLIGVFALLIYNSATSVSLNSTIEEMASSLLCQVRGMTTSTSVKEGIKHLSQLDSKLNPTLRAYATFLDNPRYPDINLIKKRLPRQKSAFDFRLVGLVNDMLALHEEESKQNPKPETIRKYLKDAKDAYEQALHFFADPDFKLPGNPPDNLASDFERSLQSNLADVHLGYGKCSEGSERREYITKAREECDRLVRDWGKRPGIYLNLISANSLLLENETAENQRKQFQEAIDVLVLVTEGESLTLADKTYIKRAVLNWKSELKEIEALVNYFERERDPLKWNTFIEQHLKDSEK